MPSADNMGTTHVEILAPFQPSFSSGRQEPIAQRQDHRERANSTAQEFDVPNQNYREDSNFPTSRENFKVHEWEDANLLDDTTDHIGREYRKSLEPKILQDTKSANINMRQRPYMLIVVSLYTSLTVAAWALLCILCERPLTAKSYDVPENTDSISAPQRFLTNKNWFRATKILLAITNTLIIPLTSTVCAGAAVAYIQRMGQRSGFTMKRLITLADRGWTNPQLLFDILRPSGWKHHGSSFLVFAILLIVIGATIPPFQQLFVGQTTIKAPSFPVHITSLTDVPNMFQQGSSWTQSILTLNARLRSALVQTSINDLQPRVWQEEAVQCNGNGSLLLDQCYDGGPSFKNISELRRPYIAQLSTSMNTGLYEQYVPRINNSVSYTSISPADFARSCSPIPSGGLYTEHSVDAKYFSNIRDKSHSPSRFALQLCMPADLSISPWQSTRDQQEISEHLYLNVSYRIQGSNYNKPPSAYHIVVNSTMGYFELPNYRNEGTAGPLLSQDPTTQCLSNPRCDSQARSGRIKRQSSFSEISNDTSLALVANQGPLSLVANALFGNGSWLERSMTNLNKNETLETTEPQCEELQPLALLAGRIHACTLTTDEDRKIDGLEDFFDLLTSADKALNPFQAATIIASQLWLASPSGNLQVTYDRGVDTERPTLSKAGMYVISILLGVDLFLLLALAVYIRYTPTWTPSLDAFAMMRLGASMADQPLLLAKDEMEALKALQDVPGWTGSMPVGTDKNHGGDEDMWEMERRPSRNPFRR